MFVQNSGYERQKAGKEYTALGKLRRSIAKQVAKHNNKSQKREEENDGRIEGFGGVTRNQANENCCCCVNRYTCCGTSRSMTVFSASMA